MNPARARDFVRSLGRLAKTDRVDAWVLREMGHRLDLPPCLPETQEMSDLRALRVRRRQLVQDRARERVRLGQAVGDWAIASARRMLAHLEAEVEASIAPKSVTAPVAIGISEAIGGLPTLTAVLVLMTGVIGAVIVTPLLNALRLRDWRARGFAAGVAAHGLGTARAFQVHPVAGAFAGLGMGLNAILSSFLVPPLLQLFD